MLGDIFNLVAAILCTIGAGVSAAALFLMEPTFVNLLAAAGAVVGTSGGVAWVIAAVILLRQRRP